MGEIMSQKSLLLMPGWIKLYPQLAEADLVCIRK